MEVVSNREIHLCSNLFLLTFVLTFLFSYFLINHWLFVYISRKHVYLDFFSLCLSWYTIHLSFCNACFFYDKKVRLRGGGKYFDYIPKRFFCLYPKFSDPAGVLPKYILSKLMRQFDKKTSSWLYTESLTGYIQSK